MPVYQLQWDGGISSMPPSTTFVNRFKKATDEVGASSLVVTMQ